MQVALDCSGSPYLEFDPKLRSHRIGRYDTQLMGELFVAVVNNSGLTLHIRQLHSRNDHHIVEACCKAIAHGRGDGPTPLQPGAQFQGCVGAGGGV